jgi:high affinity Mn2+ porin
MLIRRPQSPTNVPRGCARRWSQASMLAGAMVTLLGGSAGAAETETNPDPALKSYNLHGESTFIGQYNAPFQARYSGQNSLNAKGEFRETASATAYLGLRLWRGGEFYINPEMFHGFGLSETHGLGAFPNGEAQKGGSDKPQLYIARAFYRQTFGFGGETEQVADAPNQLAGTQDVSRLTLTAGRMPVVDIFDGNTYARDPREDFLNWTIYSQGAFDYAADQKGYGYGIVLDFNQKQWALRGGYFMMPRYSNAENFDLDVPRRGQYLLELETRHTIGGQPGKVRILGWLSRAYAGSYREALGDPSFDGETSIEDTRRSRTLYGFGITFEQAIRDDLGVFARASWRDAHSEVMAWTDADASLSAGLSLKGTRWGRPNDVVGLAGVVNFLGNDNRDYTAAGGLGINIGDGALSYRPEAVAESYYRFALRDNVALTFDYQLALNPGYNADRGPVSIFATRLRAGF